MNYKVAVIPGDGIGPEIVTEAKKVLDKTGEKSRCISKDFFNWLPAFP